MCDLRETSRPLSEALFTCSVPHPSFLMGAFLIVGQQTAFREGDVLPPTVVATPLRVAEGWFLGAFLVRNGGVCRPCRRQCWPSTDRCSTGRVRRIRCPALTDVDRSDALH